MAGEYDPRDSGRNQQVSYGSFGPWAGAVMQGLGMAPMSGLGLASMAFGLGLQGLTGKSLMDHLGLGEIGRAHV